MGAVLAIVRVGEGLGLINLLLDWCLPCAVLSHCRPVYRSYVIVLQKTEKASAEQEEEEDIMEDEENDQEDDDGDGLGDNDGAKEASDAMDVEDEDPVPKVSMIFA